MSMLPAAISCRCGFQKCVRAFSTRVTCAFLRLPSLSPRRVASSRPPAPPPTTTIRWTPAVVASDDGPIAGAAGRAAAAVGAPASSRADTLTATSLGLIVLRRAPHAMGVHGRFGLVQDELG